MQGVASTPARRDITPYLETTYDESKNSSFGVDIADIYDRMRACETRQIQ